MKIETYTDEELKMFGLLPDGEYKADVIEAIDKKDKNGNDMMALKLTIYDLDGNTKFINDWLSNSFPKKLKNFCYSANIIDKYDSKNISAKDALVRSIIVSINKKFNKDKDEWFNNVKDYLTEYSNKSLNSKSSNIFIDDDLPPF